MHKLKKLMVNPDKIWMDIKRYENIICFGAGSKGRQTLSILSQLGIYPKAFCDNAPTLLGKEINGLPIINYDNLRHSFSSYCIIITTTIEYAMSIFKMLNKENEKNPVYFLANPFKAEIKLLEKEAFEADIDKYSDSYDLLSDEISKSIFLEFLNWKMTGDLSKIYRYSENNFSGYFDSNIIPWNREQIYVDIGAYTGNDILRFLVFANGIYNKIVAFEPDNNNYESLLKFIEYGQIPNIEVYRKVLWSSPCFKHFYSTCKSGINYESCNVFEDISTIASNSVKRLISDKDNSYKVEKIMTETLDNMIKGISPTLIKVDAIASEYPILCGAKDIIKSCAPSLIMEYGTHSQYIADTIPLLFYLNPKYKFYLRQKTIYHNSRTFLYAINSN